MFKTLHDLRQTVENCTWNLWWMLWITSRPNDVGDDRIFGKIASSELSLSVPLTLLQCLNEWVRFSLYLLASTETTELSRARARGLKSFGFWLTTNHIGAVWATNQPYTGLSLSIAEMIKSNYQKLSQKSHFDIRKFPNVQAPLHSSEINNERVGSNIHLSSYGVSSDTEWKTNRKKIYDAK